MARQLPAIGDTIYVPASLYIGHGCDDIIGGLAKVKWIKPRKSLGASVHFIIVEEFPEKEYNWEEYLALEQEKLEKEYKEKRARRCPDEDGHNEP